MLGFRGVLRGGIALATAVGVLVLAAMHAARYFFLYDDFALIGEARLHGPAAILTESLFGFYRPLLFATTRLESLVFGWHRPEGYLLTSLAWHVLNAGLLFLLSQRLRASRCAALIAAAVFLVSPWATETFLWFSGRFDLMSTAGVFGAMLAALAAVDAETPRQRRRAMAACVLGTGLAAFSKESGVMTPALCAWVLVAGRPDRWTTRASRDVVLLSSLVVFVYLVMRQLALPGFGSAYGSVFALVRDADLVGNGLSLLRGFAAFPVAGSAGLLAVVTGVVVMAGALRTAPRATTFALVAVLVALVPVLPFDLEAGSSAEGRYLYLPGAFVALVVGLAGSARVVPAVAAGLVLAAGAWSTSVQVRHWELATTAAREGIERFRGVIDVGADAVYIPDFPYYLAEGPYVLEDFAFRYYFEGVAVPSVRTRNMRLRVVEGRLVFDSWIHPSPETPPEPGEWVLRLQ